MVLSQRVKVVVGDQRDAVASFAQCSTHPDVGIDVTVRAEWYQQNVQAHLDTPELRSSQRPGQIGTELVHIFNADGKAHQAVPPPIHSVI